MSAESERGVGEHTCNIVTYIRTSLNYFQQKRVYKLILEVKKAEKEKSKG